jgi:hypothetical protein
MHVTYARPMLDMLEHVCAQANTAAAADKPRISQHWKGQAAVMLLHVM